MTTAAASRSPRRALTTSTKRIITAVVVVVVLIAMFFGTKIVPKNSELVTGPAAFSASAYGKKQFPLIQKYVAAKAVDAATLAQAVDADQSAAAKKYGVSLNEGAQIEVPVKFTGKVGKIPSSGFTPVTVTGLPSGHSIAVQLGPAITGTDLRDANGKVSLGSFENQIQYQNAATGINDQLKKELTKVNSTSLTGKTISVEGVFQLVNPKQWNVTPATITVQG